MPYHESDYSDLQCSDDYGNPISCSAEDIGQAWWEAMQGSTSGSSGFENSWNWWGNVLQPYIQDMYTWASPWDADNLYPQEFYDEEGNLLEDISEGASQFFQPSGGAASGTPFAGIWGGGSLPTMSQEWNPDFYDPDIPGGYGAQMPTEWIDPILSFLANYGSYFTGLEINPSEHYEIGRATDLSRSKLYEDYLFKMHGSKASNIGTSGFSGVGGTLDRQRNSLLSEYSANINSLTAAENQGYYDLFTNFGNEWTALISQLGGQGAFDPFTYEDLGEGFEYDSYWGGVGEEGGILSGEEDYGWLLDTYYPGWDNDMNPYYNDDGTPMTSEQMLTEMAAGGEYLPDLAADIDVSGGLSECLQNATNPQDFAACWAQTTGIPGEGEG